MSARRQPILFAAICEREPFIGHPLPTRDEARLVAERWDNLGACASAFGKHNHPTAQVRRGGGQNGGSIRIIEGTIR